MSHRVFKLVNNQEDMTLGKEVQVICRWVGNDDINAALANKKPELVIESIEMKDAYIGVPSNWLRSNGMHGVARIQGYLVDENWDVKPIPLSTGLYTAVLMHVVAMYRSQGILAITKAKSQQDIIYLVKDIHLNTVPLVNELLAGGKLFKEFQRMLGTDQLQPVQRKKFMALVVDLDKYYSDNGVVLKEAADGKLICKSAVSLSFGGGLEEMYSFGMRIINHPKIRTCKGNMNFNVGEFNNICKWMDVDPLDFDVVIPIVTVKVGKVEHGDVLDVTDYIRFVSYKTERTQSYARLSTVACITHAQYSCVFSHLVNERSGVHKVTDLLSRVIEGNLDSYLKLLKGGMMANDLLGAALNAAFPIMHTDESGQFAGWSLIRTPEIVNSVYGQVVAGHKHVRKVKIKGGINRRASNNVEIEKLNVGNETGAYIIDIKKGVVNIPQRVFLDLGLGDFDGDDVVMYPINVTKDRSVQIYLVGRNPMSGNTCFIGIQKGKGSVQDVPEWAEPLLKFHKKVTSLPEAPEKIKDVIPTDLKGQVNHYVTSLFNAALNGPGLGMVTNRIYKKRIDQIVKADYPTPMSIVIDAHTLENKVVKAIKSNLENELTPQFFEGHFKMKFGSDLSSNDYLTKLMLTGDVLDANNAERYDSIYKSTLLTGDSERIWDLCSKFMYQSTYRNYMFDIVANANLLAKNERYKSFIPIVAACSGYNPDKWIEVEPTDVLKAREVCRAIIGDKRKYGLVNCDVKIVDKVNSFYSIFTSKKDVSGEYLGKVQGYIYARMMEVSREGIKGEDLVKFKQRVAKALLNMFMGLDQGLSADQVYHEYKVNHRQIIMGVRNIQDVRMRTFAYACIHTYIKAYIKHYFVDTNARTTAMFEVGSRVFGIDNGRLKSNRLFWLFASTFTKDEVMVISKLWCDVQPSLKHVAADKAYSDVLMNDALDHGYSIEDAIDVDVFSPVDIYDNAGDDEFGYDEDDYEDFDPNSFSDDDLGDIYG